VAESLARALEALAVRLSSRDYLLGDQPYLCDFAVMGQLVYLVRTPAGARAIGDSPTVTRYLERMKSLRR
jgi:glutathione S-transferase